MDSLSEIFIVDCVGVGFVPPAPVQLAAILGKPTSISAARKAEVQVFKDSEASKKAWIKIHQKNALKGLDKLGEEIAKMHALPEGKAKQKLIDKISAQSAHLEKKYLENGGDHSTFLDAQINAYNKAASLSPSTGLQDLDKAHSTTTPPASVPTPPKPVKAAPTWDDPKGKEPDQVAHAKDQNHKLGIHYYRKRDELGMDHEDTKKAYAQWQKSKDYLKDAEPGFDSGAAATKSKNEAAKIAQAEKAKLDAVASNAKQKVETAKFQAILDKDTASVVKYHDKADFQNLSKYSSDSDTSEYATTAKAITDALTEAEKKAIHHYGGSGYTAQNKSLVAGDSHTQADILKKVLDKASLPVDAKLRRNMPQKWFWDALGVSESEMHTLSDEQIKSHLGKTYTEKAFSSTSKDLTFGSAFGNTAAKSGKLQLNIRAPKGSEALDISYLRKNHGEAEIVLNRGATYVIRAIKKRAGHGSSAASQGKFAYEIDVDLIGNKKD